MSRFSVTQTRNAAGRNPPGVWSRVQVRTWVRTWGRTWVSKLARTWVHVWGRVSERVSGRAGHALRLVACVGLLSLVWQGTEAQPVASPMPAASNASAGGGAAVPVNSPYSKDAESHNTLFTAFVQRSPKYLDPASSYSSDETPFTYNIYEPLYGYDYLARPYKLIGRAAESVAEPVYLDANGKVLPDDAPGQDVAESDYVITLRHGILYQPHPAFARQADGRYDYYPLAPDALKGKYALTDFPQTGTRALTADDYVYAFRRLASPRVVSPIYALMAQHIVGMSGYGDTLRRVDQTLRQASAPGQSPPWLDLRQYGFDGVQALDPYHLRIRVLGKYPQFKYWLAMTFVAPIPWEADRFYSQPGMSEHDITLNTWPVGTGPYMLAQAERNRRYVLVRNPNFRGEPYPCDGGPGDAAQGLLRDCGKMTPFIDRVVFSLEKESIPLTGKFLQGYYDVPELDNNVLGSAMRVAASDSPSKAALYQDHGIQLPTSVEAQNYYLGFNWLDPVVGRGDTPAQQARNRALRQAISIAFDWDEYVQIFLNGQGQVANGPIPPGVEGYQSGQSGIDPVVYDWVDGRAQRKALATAKQLMVQAGYPDGRDPRTGQPLILRYDAAAGMGSNPVYDWMRRQFSKLGIELDVRSTDYNRFQDKMAHGSAQLFMWGWVNDYPDAENNLFLLYGPNGKARHGGENAANYENPAFDKLFEQMRYLNDGPQKTALIHQMVALVQQDAPWMFGYFPQSAGAYQPWVSNAKPTAMVRNTLQFLRIDPTRRVALLAKWNRPALWPVWLMLGLIVLMALWVCVAVRRRGRLDAWGRDVRSVRSQRQRDATTRRQP